MAGHPGEGTELVGLVVTKLLCIYLIVLPKYLVHLQEPEQAMLHAAQMKMKFML